MRSSRASIQRQTLETTYINGVVDGLLSTQLPGCAVLDGRDWIAELLVFSKCNCQLVISVLIERLEEQAQSMNTTEHVEESLVLCNTVDKMLSERSNLQQITETIACDALNLLFRFRQVVISNMPFDDKVEDLMSACCQLVYIFSGKFPELALNIFWQHFVLSLEHTDWDTGVFHVAEIMGYLSLTINELSENLSRIQKLFQNYLKHLTTVASNDDSEVRFFKCSCDKSEKQLKRLLLVISVPLRACIMRWMSTYASQFAALFAEATERSISSPRKSHRARSVSVDAGESQIAVSRRYMIISTEVVNELLCKIEATATGTSKRLFLWPTLIVLCCLLPKDVKRAVRATTVSFSWKKKRKK